MRRVASVRTNCRRSGDADQRLLPGAKAPVSQRGNSRRCCVRASRSRRRISLQRAPAPVRRDHAGSPATGFFALGRARLARVLPLHLPVKQHLLRSPVVERAGNESRKGEQVGRASRALRGWLWPGRRRRRRGPARVEAVAESGPEEQSKSQYLVVCAGRAFEREKRLTSLVTSVTKARPGVRVVYKAREWVAKCGGGGGGDCCRTRSRESDAAVAATRRKRLIPKSSHRHLADSRSPSIKIVHLGQLRRHARVLDWRVASTGGSNTLAPSARPSPPLFFLRASSDFVARDGRSSAARRYCRRACWQGKERHAGTALESRDERSVTLVSTGFDLEASGKVSGKGY